MPGPRHPAGEEVAHADDPGESDGGAGKRARGVAGRCWGPGGLLEAPHCAVGEEGGEAAEEGSEVDAGGYTDAEFGAEEVLRAPWDASGDGLGLWLC